MFSNDLFRELDYLIEDTEIREDISTGMFEERMEEKLYKDNFFLNSGNRGGEDSYQYGFMEAIEEYEFREWNLYWKILDNKVNKLLKNRKKLSKYDNRQENDDTEEDDGIILLGNKFKSIRI